MPKERKTDFGLPSYNDIFFSSQAEREEAGLKKIYDIPLDQIDPFPDHPFKVVDDEDMYNLAASIQEQGIITPATVRKKPDGRYELLSGHRRKRACELAGVTTLRAEVVEMERDEAVIFMVDSNLQRTTILPSEKAFSYKMRLEAMNHQGKRTDLTSSPMARKLKGKESAELLGEMLGENRDNVYRYIRLTELIPELLDKVDEKVIAFRPAVELSYLTKEQQKELNEIIESEVCTPSLSQAVRMKQLSKDNALTLDRMVSIMQEAKPNQKDRFSMNLEKLNKVMPKEVKASQREAFILKAVEHYCLYLEKKKNYDPMV